MQNGCSYDEVLYDVLEVYFTPDALTIYISQYTNIMVTIVH